MQLSGGLPEQPPRVVPIVEGAVVESEMGEGGAYKFREYKIADYDCQEYKIANYDK